MTDPIRLRSRRLVVERLDARVLLSGGIGHDLKAAATVPTMTVSIKLGPQANPDANGVVTRARVMLVGSTLPDAKVELVDGTPLSQHVVRADAKGDYRMPILLPVGENLIKVVATDTLGQEATASTSVDRGDVVIAWNATAADVMRTAKENVGMSSRNFAIVSGAMYDAINDIDPTHAAYKFPKSAPVGASPEAAASAAAYQVLLSLYPKQKATLDATMAQTMATVANGRSKAEGIAFGKSIGSDYIAWRSDDGSNAEPAYKIGTGPGQWRPTPPDYRNAWGPAWGNVTPFAVPSASAFDPPPPPALDSPEYAAAVNQVESLGAVNSTTRTADETQAGLFWSYDTAGTGPPPVLYNQILEQISLQQHNTLSQNARLFAQADMAMADAGIVAWQAKYDYALWRPVTAIQLADTDGNPATTADPTWMPLGSPGHGVFPNYTPPFPSYVSGHAAFGSALFTVLTSFYGTDNVPFTLTSDELPGVTRSYDSFSAASEENGLSRIYLGVHYSFDVTAGSSVGDNIGAYVVQHELR